ncbi:DUF1801 domain-containing protein [Olivibacter sp. CPCC 100613]|uniref:DUF1801 domain-containing protein n=1 Tax=Olivibacter sp. CPCC 100613 TaxID=3079931 RepID=UPI002FFC1D5F
MATNKTIQTNEKVADFLNRVTDDNKRDDCYNLMTIIQLETGLEPKMWGQSIIGFGSYHYRYESGHQGEAPLIGISPRSKAISLYMTCDFDQKKELLQRLGKHRVGQACVYIKKLSDIDLNILKEMIHQSINYLRNKYELSL